MSVALLKEALDFSHDKVTTIDFVTKLKSNSYSMSIYCSLIELAKSFHSLTTIKEYTGSLSIYRTFLENYVELINILDSKDYIAHIELEFHDHKLRSLKHARAGNVYLKSLINYCEEDIPKNENRISELKKELNIKRKYSIKDKFTMAGMQSEYEAVYSELCSESHCNLGALFDRHFNYDESSNKLGISIYDPKVSIKHEFYISVITIQLIDAGCRFVSTFDEKLKSTFENKKKLIEEKFVEINT